jgi:arylsulfatase A-like enzyme
MKISLDLAATLYALTKQPVPKNQSKDSRNLLPLFLDEPKAAGHDLLIQQGGDDSQVAIWQGPWKLIMKVSDKEPLPDLTVVALFNLSDNPNENEERNLFMDKRHQNRIKK